MEDMGILELTCPPEFTTAPAAIKSHLACGQTHRAVLLFYLCPDFANTGFMEDRKQRKTGHAEGGRHAVHKLCKSQVRGSH